MAAETPSSSKAPREGRTRGNGKRAVVVIHGMGSQSPMSTLRGLVDALWSTDRNLVSHGTRRTWSKRDTVSGNRELLRITTSEDKTRTRTDFFEFYWAHMMEDTRFSSVLWWLKRIFLRGSGRVPPAVRAPWVAGVVVLLLLGVVLAIVLLLALLILRAASFGTAVGWLAVAVVLVSGLWFLRHRVLVEVVGDAARYLTAAPPNIDARARIRAAGLDLLRQLHKVGEYERIVLVCHSLGTVVGYDLLSFYWGSGCERIVHKKGESDCSLKMIEEASQRLVAAADEPARAAALNAFRAAQRAYARKIAETNRDDWLITDFVTLGSPLTHAHFLLVNDVEPLFKSEEDAAKEGWLHGWYDRLDPVTRRVASTFMARAAQRAFPLAPPLAEKGEHFSYERKLPGKPRSPHHAAPFAAVRWTNIYAPRRWLLWGDVIGGPMAPLFGPGVRDIALSGAVGRSFVAHTRYWEAGHADREHLEALRAAVNLLDTPEDGATGPVQPADPLSPG